MRSLTYSDSTATSTPLNLLKTLTLVIFPLIVILSQALLYTYRNNRIIKKRNIKYVVIASLGPAILAYANLIFSLDVGVECWWYYLFTVIIHPLSIGPQILRAVKLWTMLKLSLLALSQDIFEGVKRSHKMRRPSLNIVTEEVKKRDLKVKQEQIVKYQKLFKYLWLLMVVPMVVYCVIMLVFTDSSKLSDADFESCTPEPDIVTYGAPISALAFALGAYGGLFLLKNSEDELGIRRELFCNIMLWTVSYAFILYMKFTDHEHYEAVFGCFQQSMLIVSMIIKPILEMNGYSLVPTSTAGLFCLNRGVMPIDSDVSGNSPGNSMKRRPSDSSFNSDGGSPSARYTNRNSVQISSMRSSGRDFSSGNFEGLEGLLCTDKGIKVFSEHCAREFSVENIRFWQTVNVFRTDEEEALRNKENMLQGGMGTVGEGIAPEGTVDMEGGEGSLEVVEVSPNGGVVVLGAGTAAGNSISTGGAQEEVFNDIEEEAVRIYEEYVKASGAMQVNIPNSMVRKIKALMDNKEYTRTMFDEAQLEIFNLMSRDSYQRYLKAKKNRERIERAKRDRRGSRNLLPKTALGMGSPLGRAANKLEVEKGGGDKRQQQQPEGAFVEGTPL